MERDPVIVNTHELLTWYAESTYETWEFRSRSEIWTKISKHWDSWAYFYVEKDLFKSKKHF